MAVSFWKKNQKHMILLARPSPHCGPQQRQSFCFLFQKEALSRFLHAVHANGFFGDGSSTDGP